MNVIGFAFIFVTNLLFAAGVPGAESLAAENKGSVQNELLCSVHRLIPCQSSNLHDGY